MENNDLTEFIKNNRPAVTFTPAPITQNVDGNLFITLLLKDEAYYGDPINNAVTLYRALDTKEIIGCALWVKPEDIIINGEHY